MDVGHFSYLLSGTPQHTKVAADRLELLAKTAAKRYLEEGVALNDTIKKIATENDLNSNQVQRVCEMANIATHQGLWRKTAQKESIAFQLADAKAVVSVVKKQPLDSDDPQSPTISPSSCDSDYAGPPKGIPQSGPSMISMMGADPANVHNGLHDDGEKKRIIIILQKKAGERSALESDILYKGMQLESLEKRAFEVFKQTILGGASFRDLYTAAGAGDMGKVAAEYFPGWQQRLVDESHGSTRLRLEKQALAKVPDELISNDMGNVTVINGSHPVLVSLDTVQRKTGEVKQGLHNLLRIDDQVKVYHQKMRDLS